MTVPFELPPAVRPPPGWAFTGGEGFRFLPADPRYGLRGVEAALSAGRVLPAFYALLDCLPGRVTAVLETSHSTPHGHDDHVRGDCRAAALRGALQEFEESFLADGAFGVAAVDPAAPAEVQADEHKVVRVFARDTRPFTDVLRCQFGLRHRPNIPLVGDGPHVHGWPDDAEAVFADVCRRVGATKVRKRRRRN